MVVTNSLTGGGAERSMNLVCNELTKRGWPVSLVPINSGEPDQVNPTCEIFPLGRKWKGTLKSTLAAIYRFNLVVNSWRPDVIVLNCDLPELFGSILFGKHQLVALEHTSKPWSQRTLLGKIVRRVLKFRKTIWVAVSPHLTIWPSLEKPKAVLQNPVLLPKKNETPGINSEIKRLIFIGRLSQEKRPDLALEVARLTNLELIIIGDGLMKDDLEQRVSSKAINTKFLGWIENPWSIIQAGDLLLVTSLFEGDGLIVIEGMAHDVPMLLSDIPDLRRFKFPERNYRRNVTEFVDQCKTFQYKLEELRIPQEIVTDILDARSIVVIGSLWEKFLDGETHLALNTNN
jgi:glycosyltransferase involved in cell wall biosynthesis